MTSTSLLSTIFANRSRRICVTISDWHIFNRISKACEPREAEELFRRLELTDTLRRQYPNEDLLRRLLEDEVPVLIVHGGNFFLLTPGGGTLVVDRTAGDGTLSLVFDDCTALLTILPSANLILAICKRANKRLVRTQGQC